MLPVLNRKNVLGIISDLINIGLLIYMLTLVLEWRDSANQCQENFIKFCDKQRGIASFGEFYFNISDNENISFTNISDICVCQKSFEEVEVKNVW